MKKRILLVCILGCIVAGSLTGCPAPVVRPEVAGGVSPASVSNPGVIEAAGFAVKEEEKIIRNSKAAEKAQLNLISILDAQEQIVAGTNYRLKLKVALDGNEKTAAATILWQPWSKDAPYQLTSWEWQ